MAKPILEATLPQFEVLAQRTITQATKLVDYFQSNLIYYQLISGKGLEFDRIRQYAPGMDPRRIDWKIYAKTGVLNVRAFKEEREFDIIIVVDVSDTMLLGSTKQTKAEYAAIVAGALAYASTEAGDNIGFALVSDKHMIATDPGIDFYEGLSILGDKKNYGGGKGWRKFVNSSLGSYSPDSIFFIVSDFIDTDPEEFLSELTSRSEKVYGIMVRDPLDIKLPKEAGRVHIRNMSESQKYLIDTSKIADEYEFLTKKEIEKIKNTFHDYGQLFFSLTTDEIFADKFIEEFGGEEVVL